ncbi:hypothetical protein D3C85_1417240 [compost metagenome]
MLSKYADVDAPDSERNKHLACPCIDDLRDPEPIHLQLGQSRAAVDGNYVRHISQFVQ